MSGCIRQCDWDDNQVCRSCGIDYAPPKPLRPFHLAFPVDDIAAAKKFNTEVLGCTTGREKEESCVVKFYGHQIVAHLVPKMPELSTSPVDGKQIPAMHFGLVMDWDDWHQLKARFESQGVEILYEVSGDADLIALVHVDDTMALRTLLDRMWMAAPTEIASTTTELVLEQY